MIKIPLQNQLDPWTSQLCPPGCLPPALVGHTGHVHPQCLMHVGHKELWIQAKPSSMHVHPPITISSTPEAAFFSGGTLQGWIPTGGSLCPNLFLLGAGPGGGADCHLRGHHSFPGREGQMDSRGAPRRGVRGAAPTTRMAPAAPPHGSTTLVPPRTSRVLVPPRTSKDLVPPRPAALYRAQVLLPLSSCLVASKLCKRDCSALAAAHPAPPLNPKTLHRY